MGDKEPLSVRLSGGLPHTTTWVKLATDGTLTVEWYDYSPQAQRSFGNDVAYLLTVQSSQTPRIWSLLLEKAERPANPLPDALLLLQRFQERFESYFAIKQWLDENDVPYQKSFDAWA